MKAGMEEVRAVIREELGGHLVRAGWGRRALPPKRVREMAGVLYWRVVEQRPMEEAAWREGVGVREGYEVERMAVARLAAHPHRWLLEDAALTLMETWPAFARMLWADGGCCEQTRALVWGGKRVERR